MANRLNVANIGYDDNNDALTIASDGTISAGTLGSGVVFPAGHVIDVKSTSLGVDTTLTTAQTIPNLTVSITPKSTNNKVLVSWSLMFGDDRYNGNTDVKLKLQRNSTYVVGSGSSVDDMTQHIRADLYSDMYATFHRSFTYLDSPNLNTEIVYSIYVTFGGTLYLNRRGQDSAFSFISTITAMEVVG